MNAKESIKQVQKLKTIEEVQEFLNAEKELKKPRKTVIDACEERLGEMLTEVENNTTEEEPVESGEVTDFSNFLSKIPGNCRASKIIDFAKKFYGEDLDLDKTKHVGKDRVEIYLKNGHNCAVRGL